MTEDYDAQGLPLVVTIGGMGQRVGKKNMLARNKTKVIGHFRMLHLFDYQ